MTMSSLCLMYQFLQRIEPIQSFYNELLPVNLKQCFQHERSECRVMKWKMSYCDSKQCIIRSVPTTLSVAY